MRFIERNLNNQYLAYWAIPCMIAGFIGFLLFARWFGLDVFHVILLMLVVGLTFEKRGLEKELDKEKSTSFQLEFHNQDSPKETQSDQRLSH